MEEIISLLAHFQEQLQVLNSDFQNVKNTVYNIYKENKALKEENSNLKKLLFEKEEQEKKGKEAEEYDSLERLYSEGFHVCHLDFGEKRQGDCLFCRGLLDSEESKEDNKDMEEK